MYFFSEYIAVSITSIIGMLFSLVVAFGLPIGLFFIGQHKLKAQISSFFIGCLVFLIFSLTLEGIVNYAVFSFKGYLFSTNTILRALFGGAMASLFEETGRFVSMKFFMNKHLDVNNAYMYGFGHGGFESITVLGIASINNIVYSLLINTNTLSLLLSMLDYDEDGRAEVINSLSALWKTPPCLFYLGGIERIFAILLQVAFSLFVYAAIKRNTYFYLIIAYVLHFLVDFTSVALSTSLSVTEIEIIFSIFSILCFVCATKISKT